MYFIAGHTEGDFTIGEKMGLMGSPEEAIAQPASSQTLYV